MDRKERYEVSNKGKNTRLFNYEMKMNFLLNVKAQLKCEDCGIDNPVILTFHHRNRQRKKFELGSSCASRSWQSIIKEIEKCDVLCYNCHFLNEERMPHPRQGKGLNRGK